MCNQDNALDVAACHKSSTDQDKIATVLKTYLNDWKKYLTTFQHAVLCKSSCQSAYCNSLNLWKL